MIINFDEKSGGSKLSRHAYAPRDSPPSDTLLDQNLDPRVASPTIDQKFDVLDLILSEMFSGGLN